MYRFLTVTAAALMLAGPSFAAGAMCSTSPASKFQPKANLVAMLKKDGIDVRRIKTEKGCYEVYGLKGTKKMNLGFNAETLAPVNNAEAGEN